MSFGNTDLVGNGLPMFGNAAAYESGQIVGYYWGIANLAAIGGKGPPMLWSATGGATVTVGVTPMGHWMYSVNMPNSSPYWLHWLSRQTGITDRITAPYLEVVNRFPQIPILFPFRAVDAPAGVNCFTSVLNALRNGIFGY